jgi:hypothetical protein
LSLRGLSPKTLSTLRSSASYRISICKKEAKETRHWLRMIASSSPGSQDRCQLLLKEAHELTLIFSAILLPKKD